MHIFTRFRNTHELDQQELSDLLDIKKARLSHYENGRRKVPVDVASKFVVVARNLGDTYSLENVYEEEMSEAEAP